MRYMKCFCFLAPPKCRACWAPSDPDMVPGESPLVQPGQQLLSGHSSPSRLWDQAGICLCLSQQRNVEHLGTGSVETGGDLAVERCESDCLHLMLFANGLWFPRLPT